MKYFIVSDIHSFYDELMVGLNKHHFDQNNLNHCLVILGDVFDRGEQSYQLFEFLLKLQQTNQLILIKGNHEDLLERLLIERKYDLTDYANGTIKTVLDLATALAPLNDESSFEDCVDVLLNSDLPLFLSSYKNYLEIGDYILCHGYLPFDKLNKRIYPDWKKRDFKKAYWLKGYDLATQGYILDNKTIICGHVGSINYRVQNAKNNGTFSENMYLDTNNYAPITTKGCISIDALTIRSKIVNVLVLEKGKLYEESNLF